MHRPQGAEEGSYKASQIEGSREVGAVPLRDVHAMHLIDMKALCLS